MSATNPNELALGPGGESVTWHHGGYAKGLLLYHPPLNSRSGAVVLCRTLDEVRGLKRLCERAIADQLAAALDADDADAAVDGAVDRLTTALSGRCPDCGGATTNGGLLHDGCPGAKP